MGWKYAALRVFHLVRFSTVKKKKRKKKREREREREGTSIGTNVLSNSGDIIFFVLVNIRLTNPHLDGKEACVVYIA